MDTIDQRLDRLQGRSNRGPQKNIDFYHLFKDQLTPYEQIDLSNIKPNTAISTPKDLEKSGKDLSELLTNKKNDWNKRLKGIQTIQSCFVTHDLLKMPQMYGFLAKITDGLSSQLFDLRSTITKEACKTIALIAEVLQNEFELQASQTFVTDISLFKLMESGNQIMANHAHLCVLAILYNTSSQKVIKNIMKQSLDRHQFTRINCAEYILLVLLMYPKNILDKYLIDIQHYLKKALQDSNVEVRRRARMVFIKYQSLYPQFTYDQILAHLDASYHKFIYDEYIQWGLNPDSTNLFTSSYHTEALQDANSLTTPTNERMSLAGDNSMGSSLVLLAQNGSPIQGTTSAQGNYSRTYSKGLKSPSGNEYNSGLMAPSATSHQQYLNPRKQKSQPNQPNPQDKPAKGKNIEVTTTEAQNGYKTKHSLKLTSERFRSPGKPTPPPQPQGSNTVTKKEQTANNPKQSIVKTARQTLFEFNTQYKKESSDDNQSEANQQTEEGSQSKKNNFAPQLVSENNRLEYNPRQNLGALRSPPRQKGPKLWAGLGSPKRNAKARVDSGLTMLPPPNTNNQAVNRLKGPSQANDVTSQSQSTTSTKLQSTSKLEQLKKNHYPISMRRSPLRDARKSPTLTPSTLSQVQPIDSSSLQKSVTVLEQQTARQPENAYGVRDALSIRERPQNITRPGSTRNSDNASGQLDQRIALSKTATSFAVGQAGQKSLVPHSSQATIMTKMKPDSSSSTILPRLVRQPPNAIMAKVDDNTNNIAQPPNPETPTISTAPRRLKRRTKQQRALQASEQGYSINDANNLNRSRSPENYDAYELPSTATKFQRKDQQKSSIPLLQQDDPEMVNSELVQDKLEQPVNYETTQKSPIEAKQYLNNYATFQPKEGPTEDISPNKLPKDSENVEASKLIELPKDMTLQEGYNYLLGSKQRPQELLMVLEGISACEKTLSGKHINEECSDLLLTQFGQILACELEKAIKEMKTREMNLLLGLIKMFIFNCYDNEFTQSNIVQALFYGMDASYDVFQQIKEVIDIVHRNYSNYLKDRMIIENSLQYINGNKNINDNTLMVLEYCLQLLQKTLTSSYFKKIANQLEVISAILNLYDTITTNQTPNSDSLTKAIEELMKQWYSNQTSPDNVFSKLNEQQKKHYTAILQFQKPKKVEQTNVGSLKGGSPRRPSPLKQQLEPKASGEQQEMQ